MPLALMSTVPNPKVRIEHSGGVCVVRIDGSLRTGTDQEYLACKLDEIKYLNCRKVLADLRNVTSIGSTGVNFLVGIYLFVTEVPGGRLVLMGARPRIREVLDITHLGSLISMAADQDASLAALEE